MEIKQRLKNWYNITLEIGVLEKTLKSATENQADNEYIQTTKEKLNALYKEKTDIFNAINRLEDCRERAVLFERYINGSQWDKICDIINYEWSNAHRIHQKAIKSLEKILEEGDGNG